METTLEAQIFSILAVVAASLLVLVTGGVVYLTAADWRDRRRRKRDQESAKPRVKRSKKK